MLEHQNTTRGDGLLSGEWRSLLPSTTIATNLKNKMHRRVIFLGMPVLLLLFMWIEKGRCAPDGGAEEAADPFAVDLEKFLLGERGITSSIPDSDGAAATAEELFGNSLFSPISLQPPDGLPNPFAKFPFRLDAGDTSDARNDEGTSFIESALESLMSPSHAADRIANALRAAAPLSGVDEIDAQDKFDYIVVGGGAAGCPLAATLAGKFRVLLIERGPERTAEEAPLAMGIDGAGIVINDKSVSQLVITPRGVRTHIGAVMGGGTAINVAIYIEEIDEYFDHLEKKYPGVKWNKPLVKESFAWVKAKSAYPMPEQPLYGVRWREALDSNGFKRFEGGSSEKIEMGNNWGSYSLFDSKDNFYRNAADVLLGEEKGKKRPPGLTVLTKHTVKRVIFDTSQATPKAVCVEYTPTAAADIAPLISRQPTILGLPVPSWMSFLEGFLNPVKIVQYAMRPFHMVTHHQPPMQACIREGGEIIISSGAILTPTLLFKSGVGPKEQIEELNIPLVKEIPDLGQHLSDRVFIPVGTFFKDPLPKKGFAPRICQSVGMRPFGPKCEDYEIGSNTLNCTLATTEELSGGNIPEGVIYSTRYIFPPEWRDDPLMDQLFTILNDCSRGVLPYGAVVFNTICQIAMPVIRCFRSVAANFYFTAEPKSRGFVKVQRDGKVIVDPKYLTDEQDLFDAVRGVSTIVRIINSDKYKGVIQPNTESSCPVTVLNGFLDLILQTGSETRPNVGGDNTNFEKIRDHMEELIPKNARRRRRLMVNDEMIEVDAKKLTELGLREQLEKNGAYSFGSEEVKEGDSSSSSSSSDKGGDSPLRTLNYLNAMQRRLEEVSDANDECMDVCHSPIHFGKYSKTCDNKDVFNYAYGRCRLQGLAESEGAELEASQDDDSSPTRQVPYINGLGWISQDANKWRIKPSPKQWAATYPPILPDPDDPVDLAKYALTYQTSIWHLSGTAQFGKVTDSSFRVVGIDSLSIVDASVLPQITRMNPTATLMMLGRYAAVLKLRERGIDI